jgi:putative oxidoreductase
MLQKLTNTQNDPVLGFARLVLGIVFFAHGAQKMLGWFGGAGFSGTMSVFAHIGQPAPVAFLVICIEFFGGFSLLVGLLSRLAALGITAEMIGAVLTVHSRFGFFMNWTGQKKGEGFEYHLLTIALAVLVLVRGAGALSIDRLIAVRR